MKAILPKRINKLFYSKQLQTPFGNTAFVILLYISFIYCSMVLLIFYKLSDIIKSVVKKSVVATPDNFISNIVASCNLILASMISQSRTEALCRYTTLS